MANSKKVSYPDIDKLFESLPKGMMDKVSGTDGSALKKKATTKKKGVSKKKK